MDPAAILNTGVAHHRAGRLDEAERAYRTVLAAHPDDAQTGHFLAMIHLGRERWADALALLDRVQPKLPTVTIIHSQRALALNALARTDEAVAACRRALAVDPDSHHAHRMLAKIGMPGDDYLAVLGRFHAHLAPATYVEIGIATGRSLVQARPPTRAIGIAPDPKLAEALSAETRIFAEPSDRFFATHDLASVFDGRPVELAFIDGLHTFDQALRDFLNVERWSRPETVVVFHDCLPLDAHTAARERRSTFWTGDTWKVIPLLREHRPDLAVFTIPAEPSGLGVVTTLDPASTRLDGRLDAIIADYMRLDFVAAVTDREAVFNVIPNDWPAITAALARLRPQR
ncbi:MAG: tetratricopeptide repeat protein [Alphaproteobacteria bacterium]|nr:tetratricopeptide repeat protein [Alphaproteobacteria bacterium]